MLALKGAGETRGGEETEEGGGEVGYEGEEVLRGAGEGAKERGGGEEEDDVRGGVEEG